MTTTTDTPADWYAKKSESEKFADCIVLAHEVKRLQAEVERLLTIAKITVEYISEYEPRQFYRNLINQKTK